MPVDQCESQSQSLLECESQSLLEIVNKLFTQISKPGSVFDNITIKVYLSLKNLFIYITIGTFLDRLWKMIIYVYGSLLICNQMITANK
jgi:hypothetical protein